VTHPSTTTHADVDAQVRQALGITDGLIRISVGLEDPHDLIADFEQAIAASC
jgi:cystathionine beta-lyase/cystathionine gamma-synthase